MGYAMDSRAMEYAGWSRAVGGRRWLRGPLLVVAVAAFGLFGAGTTWAGGLWTDGTTGRYAPGDPLHFGAFAELAEAASPAVVSVNASVGRRSLFGQGAGLSQGSGFLVTAEGHIVTNHHVIEGSEGVRVQLDDGRQFPARVLGSDPQTDIALLRIEVEEPLPFLSLGDSSRVRVGEWVIAVGSPFGLEHTVTVGIVSAIGRRDIRPEGRELIADFIQTDASINPGSSGGPLIDLNGNVVAVNTALNPRGNNVGFAIPINMVKALLPQLSEGRVSRSWLGVAVDRVTPQVARERGLERARGALVTRVTDGSPAFLGGMLVGDIVLEFNGQPVRDNFELPWLAAVAGVGTVVPVRVDRGGADIALLVEMGAPRSANRSAVEVGEAVDGGFRVESVPGAAGLQVRRVEPGSVAARAGLQEGDLITACAGVPVADVEALRSQLERARQEGPVRLRVARGSATAMVLLRY